MDNYNQYELTKTLPTFVGIDLAWKCVPGTACNTAVCQCDSHGNLSVPRLVSGDDEIVGLIPPPDRTWLAVDASLRVPNLKGMRQVEKEVARSGIPILPTNQEFLGRVCGGSRGERLANIFIQRGFDHASPKMFGPGLMFECYPHGILRGMIKGTVPRYKRGPTKQRKDASHQVLEVMGRWEPTVRLGEEIFVQIEVAEPAQMRSMGDKIDAMLCAICLYAHWLYGGKRTHMFGDGSDGFILLVR